MEQPKKWYLSKVIWLNIFAMVAIVVPQSKAWVDAHLSEAGGVFAAVNFVLRFFTDEAIG